MGTIQIVLYEAEGYRPPTIAEMLKSEGIFVSRRGVAKFYQEYTYLFATKTETGKLKRNDSRSIPQYPFANRFLLLFLNGRPLYGYNRGTFLMPTICI